MPSSVFSGSDLRRAALAVAASWAAASSAGAQSTPAAYADAAMSWLGRETTPGFERVLTDAVAARYSGWARDRFGNLVKHVGSGAPRRVVACAADDAGYAVSEIRDDGYVRVQTAGNARRTPLWDQFHEGQRVLVLTTVGSEAHGVPGVFGVRSTHLWRRRNPAEPPHTVDDLWLDVGARSRAEVEKLGITMLAPVVRDWPGWRYAGHVAGPDAAGRAGCAAVASAAQARATTSGETIFVLAASSSFGLQGLTGAIGAAGSVDTVVLLDGDRMRAGAAGVTLHAVATPWAPLPELRAGVVTTVSLPVRYAGTLVESVADADVAALDAAVARAAGVATQPPAPIAPLPRLTTPQRLFGAGADSLSRVADLLGRFTDLYAVSGHEPPVRDALLAAMPAWARNAATVDSAGDVVLALGPDRDTTAFVAHMDEIGFEVTHIAGDGTVSLRMRGGGYLSLWEGQTALLHRAAHRQAARVTTDRCAATQTTALAGVFVPRDSAALARGATHQPTELTAWFGLDSAQLVAEGVAPGSAVTSYKCSTRLARVRFSARSIDDRAGTISLLAALDAIDPAKLTHKVIFAWSVREETGLEGARVLAERFRSSAHRVYAVDTFVSSDSPLDNPRFALTPIGLGAVVRGLDNSSATSPDEIARVVDAARAARIPIQVGTTNGGNDGAQLARWGVADVPISWPLRYSHSPAEVIDLNDIRALVRLVAALAQR